MRKGFFTLSMLALGLIANSQTIVDGANATDWLNNHSIAISGNSVAIADKLPAGYGITETSKVFRVDMALNGPNSFWLFQGDMFDKDRWFYFDATGLEVGADYEIKAEISKMPTTNLAADMFSAAAWETGGTKPAVSADPNVIKGSDTPSPTFAAPGVIEKTVKATSATMTFGIGTAGNQSFMEIKSWTVIKKGATSTTDIDAATVNVYPNPVNSGEPFTVSVPEGYTYEVYNITGAKVSAENLSAGIYIVSASNGSKTVVKKLVVN